MDDIATVRLWSRLAMSKPMTSREEETDEFAVLQSVREHLGWMLNSHSGDAPACPDYGLPDLSGIIAGLPKSENAFSSALRKSILEHEPRISHASIWLNPGETGDASDVHFTIEITVKTSGSGTKRRLEGAVNIDNVISVG
ncbi:MAG: type VI secretion system baseplate subunit TssE [bacterium]|nr:type VI secretion system baseplate subunit TssE [bacterium]